MESSEDISIDKSTVVIQFNPRMTQDGVICDEGQEAGGENQYAALKGFFKAEPKALAIVQIMVGLMVFFLGIVLSTNVPEYNYLAVLEYSGITYWGSLVYISAGSLSAAAQKQLNPCLVKASQEMNIFSTLIAKIAILLMSLQLAFIPTNRYFISRIVVILPSFSSSSPSVSQHLPAKPSAKPTLQ